MRTDNTHFDIAISGAGPVGLSLAVLLIDQGISPERLVILDTRLGEQSDQRQVDPRSIALSYGSGQILQKIGAWPIDASPIEEVHVSRRSCFGRTLLRCSDYNLPALGYVARYADLVDVLLQRCRKYGVRMMKPAPMTALIEGASQMTVSLGAEQSVSADVVVKAEGGQFAEQSAKAFTRDYRQTAIVAQVAVSSPILQRAFERFTDEGPLALLPQYTDTDSHSNRSADGAAIVKTHYALVWCMQAMTAQALLALSDADFLTALQNAFGDRLGRFLKATPRAAFPLGLNAGAPDTLRSVSIGNAAQTLHPVAGQGLNLGLRDATVLARLLATGATPEILADFAKRRQRDRSMTIRLTDIMARIFLTGDDGTADSPFLHAPLQSLLGLSLAALDGIAPAKHLLAQQMMFGSR